MKRILLLILPFLLYAVDVSNLAGSTSAAVLLEDSNSTAQNSTQSTSNQDILKQSPKITAFGSHLFSGNFTQSTQHIYNPDYKIAVADVISLKIWGAVSYESNLVVDSQGNIFVPQVGAIKVLGVKNSELLSVIQASVSKIYKDNVYVYADMNAYQNVSVFVTGSVNSPGLYKGLSSDSVVQYIDKAGGINLDYGSFRYIQILRDNKILANIDLYDFLLKGKLSLLAFRTGDVILVSSLKSYVSASGDVQKPFRFELKDEALSLQDLAILAGAKPIVTNAIVKSYANNHIVDIKSYSKKDFASVMLKSADEVEFRPDYNANDVNIRIEGEHSGAHFMVVRKGSTLDEVVSRIVTNAQSDITSVQVFRKSVALTQKQLIDAQLKELETLALTAPSVNSEGAAIRANQAKTILDFIQRAKQVQPKGQIIIDSVKAYKSVVLEEGDTIVVPSKNNLVVVQGEVSLPGSFVYMPSKKLDYYINLAGDYSDRADTSKVLVINSNGKATKYNQGFLSFAPEVKAGDSILVLPKVDSQGLQITSMLVNILYQVAIATNVVLNINR
ncbi:polysaccharide biosynthesis/export family protein [Campylobacter avium]|uniref:polysaccharide biosynthesis/export family protein n=1 Tax=Campylobacter avium TaxID=522485 RepID=UPI002356CD45|nr:polysaccharide biosynthesis/export family protein [Campylobacter avium]